MVKASFSGDKAASYATKLAQAANILNIPTIITEQYPKGLGSSVKGIKHTEAKIIEKSAFSAMFEPKFAKEIKKTGGTFDNEVKTLLKGLKANSKLIIEDIEAVGPDGVPRALSPIVFKVK